MIILKIFIFTWLIATAAIFIGQLTSKKPNTNICIVCKYSRECKFKHQCKGKCFWFTEKGRIDFNDQYNGWCEGISTFHQ